MPDRIDIEKIEEAALSAIDDLFTETEKETVDPAISNLEEAILALDWEFSQEELLKLQKSIGDLKIRYNDRLNSILLTMTENIVKFLISYKDLAPPNAITILSKIVKIFKEINSNHMSEADKKDKIKEAYDIFTFFKQDIQRIKEDLKKEGENNKKVEILKSEKDSYDFLKIKGEIIKIFEQKFKEFEQRFSVHGNLRDNIFSELSKIKEDIAKLSSDVKSLGVSVELLLGLKGEFQEIKNNLEKILSNAQEIRPREEMKSEEASGVELEVKPEELEVQEPFIEMEIEVEKEKDETFEKVRNEDKEEKEEDKEEKVREIFEVEYPYVRLFKFGKDLVAIPVENISNVYSISTSKAMKLVEKDTIRLKEIKSFWKKLKSNMKGDLKDLDEKQLEKLEVPILHLSFEDEENKKDCSYAVLLSLNDKRGILFLGRPFKKLYLPEKGSRVNEKDILAKIDTPEGKAILVDLDSLLG